MTTRAAVTVDHRIPFATRVVAALIVPFLVAAFVILYLFPDDTAQLFAWRIEPRMSALLMGAGYIAGAYFFTRTFTASRWHHVAIGFLPVATFASMLMVVTVLHWERFNHGHISFIAWVTLYATTPIIILALWLRNRPLDPGTPEAGDLLVPIGARMAMASVAALILIVGALLFLRPSLLIPFWPWEVTVGSARSLGAWFVLPGVLGLLVAREPRWSAVRLVLQSQLIGILLILMGALRAWTDFDPANPLTRVFLVGMGALAVGIGVLLVYMERRR